MADIKTVPSPCKSCTTVEDPADCERKTCKRWRTWFLEQWDYLAPRILQMLKEKEGGNEQE